MSDPGVQVGTISYEKLRWETARSTVPLYTTASGKIVPYASSVLFQIADCHFILTCAHGVAQCVNNKLPLFLVRAGELIEPRHVKSGELTACEASNLDVVDVAVVKLPPDIVDYLLPAHRFVNITEIDVEPLSRKGTYLVAGYPTAMTQQDDAKHIVTTESLGYITSPYHGELVPDTEYNPGIHIVLDYQRDSFGPDGRPSASPDPSGMSGCGIWWLTERETVENVELTDAKLVAIQHRYSKTRNYVMGTRIALAVEMIRRTYKNLWPAMALVYPAKRSE